MSGKPAGREAERDAASPWAMPAQGWKEVLLRTWREAGDDNVGLVAAGVAFYGFLALVPLLGATVLSYGLVADPSTVVRNMKGLTSVMPGDAAKLVGEQLMNVVRTSGTKKGLGLLVALAIALFGARSGAGSVVTALNIAYEEKEKRGFVMLNLLSLGITAAAVAVAIVAVIAIAALGHLEKLVPGAPGFVLAAGKIASYALLVLGGAAAAATLYRYGPSRKKAQWVWLTPGSMLAALLWMVVTLGFGVYVAKFGSYNATYGSLGAVVVLRTWLYLSSYVLLFGAELNSELEHQTARDTTEGASKPAGERGAWAADNVAGKAAADKPASQPASMAAAGGGRIGTEPAASNMQNYLAARVTSRLGRAMGLRKVGMVSSGLTTAGLAMIRRRDGAPSGVALIGVAIGLAWLSGKGPEEAADRRDGPTRRH